VRATLHVQLDPLPQTPPETTERVLDVCVEDVVLSRDGELLEEHRTPLLVEALFTYPGERTGPCVRVHLSPRVEE